MMIIHPLIRMGRLAARNVPKSSCFSFSSSQDETYVKTIRAQQKIKDASECGNEVYNQAQYLILDIERDLVLVNADRTSSKLNTLMWRTCTDVTNAGFSVKEDAVFLSVDNRDGGRFAITFPSSKDKLAELQKTFSGHFLPLRKSLFTLSSPDSKFVSQAHSLLRWNFRFNFCPSCGGRLERHPVGAHKVCGSCNETHYPNISPVGIVLISNKDHSKTLLVRQPRHPPGMYSCIAGFIEVGESVEENIRREVAEEVGLSVSSIEYMGSQHWSLPASRLMIACMATVHDGELDLDRSELEAGEWFTPEQMKGALNRVMSRSTKLMSEPDQLWVPPPGAIAHDLIKYWLNKYH